MSKPGLPSGTRDFGPETMLKRKYVTGIIENSFRLYGFRPIETPAVENLQTLTGKYGDEGEQLLFKVLNNGDFLAKANQDALKAGDSRALTPSIADRGLRYDLTVPLARFVVMNRDKLAFPFRRYQMQPVWRADRPQKGRYREFWQCDADIVGSHSVLNEADLTQLYDEVFTRLNLPVVIRLNHRKIFDAFAGYLGGNEALLRFMQLVDKNDKIGFEGVKNELAASGISHAVALWQFIYDTNEMRSNNAKLDALRAHTGADPEWIAQAAQDLQTILELVSCHNRVSLDLTLARGLSYYTGTVFEVVPQNTELATGSIGGGGRYDNLTGVFGLKDVPGVGISFGLDRICDIMEAAGLYPSLAAADVRVLICPMDETSIPLSWELLRKLRAGDVACEVYPAAAKLKKQLDYANARGIPFAAIIGENEVSARSIALKDLNNGTQQTYPVDRIADHLHLWQF